MKITADTNVLVRAIVDDDPRQGAIAQRTLEQASLVALTLPALCELVWVLSQVYKTPRAQIGQTLRRLVGGENVMVDHAAVEAGLAVMDAGGDFADGVIAHQGLWLGGETFVSFDKRAVKSMKGQALAVQLLN